MALNAVGDGYNVGDTITILGSAIGGTDGVNDMTLSVATLDPSSMVSFGTLVSGNRIDAARFSGSISLYPPRPHLRSQKPMGPPLQCKTQLLGD